MANLNGQNIGTNYKGIINIGSTVNQNVSASLQSLTDGDGTNLPIQASTAQIIIGGGSSTGRLVVRSDGANPAFRVESAAGTAGLTVANNGIQVTIFELSVTDNITIAATRGFYYGSRVGILAPNNGILTIKNSFTDGFDRLQFGGTTNLYPSLKRSTTSLQARLADDSNFTNIQGKLTTETNYTAGAIIPTGYLTVYDATGTAYKIPSWNVLLISGIIGEYLQ